MGERSTEEEEELLWVKGVLGDTEEEEELLWVKAVRGDTEEEERNTPTPPGHNGFCLV